MSKFNRIFQIGFNKCGTVSISNLFNRYSIPILPCIHWNYGYLAKDIYTNITTGNFLPLFGYSSFYVFSDMECFIEEENNIKYIPIYKQFFDLLDINYPNSIFILNTRPIDKWIHSRLNHYCSFSTIKNNFVQKIDKPIKYVDLFKIIYRTNNEKDITDIWKQEWLDHHYNVMEYFSIRPSQLLIYDIEQDSFNKFIHFFNHYNISFNTTSLPYDNRTNNYVL